MAQASPQFSDLRTMEPSNAAYTCRHQSRPGRMLDYQMFDESAYQLWGGLAVNFDAPWSPRYKLDLQKLRRPLAMQVLRPILPGKLTVQSRIVQVEKSSKRQLRGREHYREALRQLATTPGKRTRRLDAGDWRKAKKD